MNDEASKYQELLNSLKVAAKEKKDEKLILSIMVQMLGILRANHSMVKDSLGDIARLESAINKILDNWNEARAEAMKIVGS